MGGKICLRCKGKTLVGVAKKLLKTKSLLTTPSNVLRYISSKPSHHILNLTEGDGIESGLSSEIFFTLIHGRAFMMHPWDKNETRG